MSDIEDEILLNSGDAVEDAEEGQEKRPPKSRRRDYDDDEEGEDEEEEEDEDEEDEEEDDEGARRGQKRSKVRCTPKYRSYSANTRLAPAQTLCSQPFH